MFCDTRFPELLVLVLSYLGVSELAKAARVCKFWCSLSKENGLWRNYMGFVCSSGADDLDAKDLYRRAMSSRAIVIRIDLPLNTQSQPAFCFDLNSTDFLLRTSDAEIMSMRILPNWLFERKQTDVNKLPISGPVANQAPRNLDVGLLRELSKDFPVTGCHVARFFIRPFAVRKDDLRDLWSAQPNWADPYIKANCGLQPGTSDERDPEDVSYYLDSTRSKQGDSTISAGAFMCSLYIPAVSVRHQDPALIAHYERKMRRSGSTTGYLATAVALGRPVSSELQVMVVNYVLDVHSMALMEAAARTGSRLVVLCFWPDEMNLSGTGTNPRMMYTIAHINDTRSANSTLDDSDEILKNLMAPTGCVSNTEGPFRSLLDGSGSLMPSHTAAPPQLDGADTNVKLHVTLVPECEEQGLLFLGSPDLSSIRVDRAQRRQNSVSVKTYHLIQAAAAGLLFLVVLLVGYLILIPVPLTLLCCYTVLRKARHWCIYIVIPLLFPLPLLIAGVVMAMIYTIYGVIEGIVDTYVFGVQVASKNVLYVLPKTKLYTVTKGLSEHWAN